MTSTCTWQEPLCALSTRRSRSEWIDGWGMSAQDIKALNLFQGEMNHCRNRLLSLTEATAFQMSKLEQMSSFLLGESCFVSSSDWREDMKRIAICQVSRISVALPLLCQDMGSCWKGSSFHITRGTLSWLWLVNSSASGTVLFPT